LLGVSIMVHDLEWLDQVTGRHKTPRVKVGFPPVLREFLDKLRREKGLTMAGAIRMCVRHVYAEHQMSQSSKVPSKHLDLDRLERLGGIPPESDDGVS